MTTAKEKYGEVLKAGFDKYRDGARGSALEPFIDKAAAGEALTGEEATAVMRTLMEGGAPREAVASLLIALEIKGYGGEEIAAFADTMRSFARKIELKTPSEKLCDTCGTGGDGSGSINVSTTAMFVLAGAGTPVAKHGNRAASSKCGSADVLEELGVKVEIEPEQSAECIDALGVGFLFARTFHPAMRHVADIRLELGKAGIRSVFNFLGPLTNPAGAKRQLLGISKMEMMEPMIMGLKRMGHKRALVVCGLPTAEMPGNMDEVSVFGPTKVAELKESGEVETYEVHPRDYGLACAKLSEVAGGDKSFNAFMLRNALEGKAPGAVMSLVYLNAAAALVAGGAAKDIGEGLAVAGRSISSGAALEKLNQLIEKTSKF